MASGALISLYFRLNRLFAFFLGFLFLGGLFKLLVLALELINPTCSIHQFGFPCVVGVRGAGNFKLYQRILHTIHLNRFLGFRGRLGNKNIVIRHVFERH